MSVESLIQSIRGFTLLPIERIQNLISLLDSVSSLEGNMCEIGVFRGGISKLIAELCPNRKLYCVDTFEGIKQSEVGRDFHKDGEFSCTLSFVQKHIGPKENIYYLKGLFPDIFPKDLTDFSFVHSDTDTFFGTKATLDVFLPRLLLGGVILFDDYNWHHCPGVSDVLNNIFPNYDSASCFEKIEHRANQCSLRRIK